MKTLHFLAVVLMLANSSFAQIMSDTSVQVIAYWKMDEKQSYLVNYEKLKIKEGDTSRESMTYTADIHILDSTANSYTMEWMYRDFKMNTKDEFSKKLLSLSQDLKIVVKTDEMGMFQEVLNWKDIRAFGKRGMQELRKGFKGQKNQEVMDKLMKQIEATYFSKEAIESTSIKEIQQFLTFHGAQYVLDEVLEGQLEVPNIYGSDPLLSNVQLYLDEIDVEDGTYLLRSSESIDQAQLIKATSNYLKKLADQMNVESPDPAIMQGIQNETTTSSEIHSSGWVINSIQNKIISLGNVKNIELRTIELL